MEKDQNLALFIKKDRVLATGVSASASRPVELSQSGQRFKAEAPTLETLPEGNMEQGHQSGLVGLPASINRTHKISGSLFKTIAVALTMLSATTCIIFLSVPAGFSEKEIAVIFQIGSSRHTPFPHKEIYLDFLVQGISKANSDAQDIALIVPCWENTVLGKQGFMQRRTN
jgi:type IV pilus assembly protein PilM